MFCSWIAVIGSEMVSVQFELWPYLTVNLASFWGLREELLEICILSFELVGEDLWDAEFPTAWVDVF